MTDAALIAFLEWAVPRLGLRWEGLRNFRATVRKRLGKRMSGLGLADLDAYRARLERDDAEWAVLDAMCHIPISRLYRDRAVYDRLSAEILPERARVAEREGRGAVRIWSAGCASGEEPWTLAMVWHVDVASLHPDVALEIIATDADQGLLARARRGAYGAGSVRELPSRLRDRAMVRDGERFVVRDELRAYVTFRCEDLRQTMPDGPFDVVLCRNVLLTYVEESRHRALVEQLIARLRPGGVLIVGVRESMPDVPSLARAGDGVYATEATTSSRRARS